MPAKKEPCVYKIVNIVNGKKYVGSALRVKQRWRDHTKSLNENKHHSIHLQRAWNKYGEENFIFSIIEYCDRDIMLVREQYWIDKLEAFGKNGYNMCPVAGSALGVKRSEENKRKNSETKKRLGLSVGERNPMFGKTGELSPVFGKKQTPEQIAKRVAATALTKASKPKPVIDKKRSFENVSKNTEGNRGRKLTPEQREHLSRVFTGRKQSKEQIAKKSASGKSAWAAYTEEARLLRSLAMALAPERKNNTSGYPGVKPVKGKIIRWKARATINKKEMYLGIFDTPEAANAARVKYLTELKAKLESKLANPPC
jgi:group I intron endonuclease